VIGTSSELYLTKIRDPPERARTETGGADQWVLKQREFPLFSIVIETTPAYVGYPLSVFIKKSTLKRKKTINLKASASTTDFFVEFGALWCHMYFHDKILFVGASHL